MYERNMLDVARRYILPAFLLFYFAALVYHHAQIVIAPVPLDLYEGTMLLITGIIAEGGNPYTFEFQPHAADVYPPLYNIITAPLTGLFGNTFQLHRLVSAFFILGALALVGFATKIHSGSSRAGAAAAAGTYAALLFYATPVSSTNALGVALFLASVIVPRYKNYSVSSLVVAASCALFAFYAKQYFILGMPILCLYVFLYVSMARGFFLGLGFGVALLVSLAMVHNFSPYYLDNTLFAPSVAINGLQTVDILVMQLAKFAQTYAGLLLALLVYGLASILRSGVRVFLQQSMNFVTLAKWDWRGPLIVRSVDYYWFCLFWASLVVVAWLGKNPGNYMTYLFQLMSPFLLIAGFSTIAGASRKWWPLALLAGLSLYQAWAILHKDFSVDLENWHKVEAMIADSEDVLATQMLLEVLLRHDKRIYQDGHTFYFPLAAKKPTLFEKTDEGKRVQTIWDDYIAMLYRKIEQKEFDLILLSPWEMRGIFMRNPPPSGDITGKQFLSRYYRRDEKMALSMTDRHGAGTWNIQAWRPKRKRPSD